MVLLSLLVTPAILAEDLSGDASLAYATGAPPAVYDVASYASSSESGGGNCDSFCDDTSCSDRLLGLIAPSDHCLCDFISPMTNPVFFEDPRTLTEARIIFIHHTLPNQAPLAGGNVQLLAMQLRAALTDDLSIIATKDGFIFAGPDAPHEDGWADVNIGLKYNIYKDYDAQQVVSVGARYELPIGSQQALQGNGNGEFDLFLSGAALVTTGTHFMSAAGLRLPANTNAESQVFYWSGHLDRQLGASNFYLLGEVNWYHWMKSGAAGIAGIEGLDLYNFGSTGVAGNDIVTGAFGLKFKPNCHREYGIAWEAPLTDRRDILDNRLTVDVILRY